MKYKLGASARVWSSDELQQLRELAGACVLLDVIAAKLRRTRSAIRNKAAIHGISLRNVSHRAGAPERVARSAGQ